MDHPDERYKIVSNMLYKNDIIGMTENEIIDLLGNETENAPESFKYPYGEFPDESTLTYYLGVDFIDCNWLAITMKDAKVVSYEIGIT